MGKLSEWLPNSKGLAGGYAIPLFLLPYKYLLSQGVPFIPVPWLHTLTRIPESLCTGPLTPVCLLEAFLWSPCACSSFTGVSLATGMVNEREGQQERTLIPYLIWSPQRRLLCGITTMPWRLAEFHANSFTHFVGFDHFGHKQSRICNSKGPQRILLLLISSPKPHWCEAYSTDGEFPLWRWVCIEYFGCSVFQNLNLGYMPRRLL